MQVLNAIVKLVFSKQNSFTTIIDHVQDLISNLLVREGI